MPVLLNLPAGAKSLQPLKDFFTEHLPGLLSFAIRVLLALVIFWVGNRLIQWVRRLVRLSMERAGSEKGARQFADSFLKFGLHILLILFIGGWMGVETTSIAALIASGGVAVGLALQGSLANLAGGMLILTLKPFVVGDYIVEDTHGNEGTVSEIQIFYTKLTTVDNRIVVIPNGTLANNSLTNMTGSAYRQLDLKIPVSYEADLGEAKQLLRELLDAEPRVIREKGQNIFVHELGESAVVLGVRGWTKTEDYWSVRWKLLEEIKLTLDEHGVVIPYSQMTVHVRQAEQIQR